MLWPKSIICVWINFLLKPPKGSRSTAGDDRSPTQSPNQLDCSYIALIFLPIVAIIAIPLYAYHHDFSLAAWISMFVLLGVSSLGITAGYHRLWAHRAYEATLPLQIILMIMGTFAVQNSICLGRQATVPITAMSMMSIKIHTPLTAASGLRILAGCFATIRLARPTIKRAGFAQQQTGDVPRQIRCAFSDCRACRNFATDRLGCRRHVGRIAARRLNASDPQPSCHFFHQLTVPYVGFTSIY